MNYYYTTDGTEVVGPYSLSELHSLLGSGTIPNSAQVCAEGTESWTPITALFTRSEPPPVPSITHGRPPASAKRHSIFYYVFWGTLSLFGTLAILFLGFTFLTAAGTGFLRGLARHVSKTEDASSTTIATKNLPPLTDAEAQEANRLLAGLRAKRDDIEGITWYSPNEAGGYRTAVYLYIGQKEKGQPLLRWKIRYYGDDWLFIRRYRVKIDQQEPKTLLPTTEIKRDHSGGSVWEIFDESAIEHAQLLNQILAGNSAYLRMEGSEGHHDLALGSEQLQRMRDVLLVYRHLGGTWPAQE